MTALPRWLPHANRLVKALNRAGVALGTIQVLEVRGRTSGLPRATPVSPLVVGGAEYVIAGLKGAEWARNAAAAGEGTLTKGRARRAVRLVEVTDPDIRRRVMRAFPIQVPHGVMFFVRIGLVEGPDPEQFARASDDVRVFELVPPA